MVSELALNLEGFLELGYSTVLVVDLDMKFFMHNVYMLVGNISIINFLSLFMLELVGFFSFLILMTQDF